MIDLKDRVVVITGAGRGLGAAYASLFAQYGATVVVNDLGTDGDGRGSDPAVAGAQAERILAAGGRATPDHHDVSTAEGARALVEETVAAHGRIDVLVHNAGLCTSLPFVDSTWADFEQYMAIHLGALVHLGQAVWPVMRAQGGGRIVATESSAGLYGLAGQSTYAAAKGAVHGLMRTMAIEGREHGILVNSVEPGGYSRMHPAAISDPIELERMRRTMPAELVAPAVVWMGSDACRETGQTFTVRSGLVVRIGIGFGHGYFDAKLTPEAIAEHYTEVASLDGFYEPTDVIDGLHATTGRADFQEAYADVLGDTAR
jgi:NAD(P)-dependent dehydrogenase (short-subunit alcohol dehydrogenase family)